MNNQTEVLFETLRFAMRNGMSEGTARAMFDRAIHELPERWRVTKATPAAVHSLVSHGFDKRLAMIERAHVTKRNDWQRELLRMLLDDETTFADWSEKLREYDQIVLTTRAENRANDVLPQEILNTCFDVPAGLFLPKGHSSWALGPAEQNWLQQVHKSF